MLVSAALRDREAEAVVQTPGVEWVVSDAILHEYRSVLARPKFALPAPVLTRWLALIDRATTRFEVDRVPDFPPDAGDAAFLACALAAEAEFLVTGDRDFEHARKLGATAIVSVSQFKRFVCDPPSTGRGG